MHFTWSERRDTQPPEIDIVLFPGNGTFSKLPGRRMFLLSHNSDEKLFFWCLSMLLLSECPPIFARELPA